MTTIDCKTPLNFIFAPQRHKVGEFCRFMYRNAISFQAGNKPATCWKQYQKLELRWVFDLFLFDWFWLLQLQKNWRTLQIPKTFITECSQRNLNLDLFVLNVLQLATGNVSITATSSASTIQCDAGASYLKGDGYVDKSGNVDALKFKTNQRQVLWGCLL